MLFEQITPGTSVIIERMIKHVIENYEPRVEVISVDVTAYPDENHIYVELKFIIVGTIETITTNFFLERTL
jgi:predicted component of type VI protein secretion system